MNHTDSHTVIVCVKFEKAVFLRPGAMGKFFYLFCGLILSDFVAKHSG